MMANPILKQNSYNTATKSAQNRFAFLYGTLFLPLLKDICTYLDKFTITTVTKGPYKNDRHVTLPHASISPFNKLLDDAALCFFKINQATSNRSHAAQYLADKHALLTETEFTQMCYKRNTAIYITSDMEYVGCTNYPRRRRMEHIHKLMRHYLDIEKTSLPIYAKTRAQGKLAMAKLCVLIPFEKSSNLCKFTDEMRSIRILCPSKNVRYEGFTSHKTTFRARRPGSHQRARLKGGQKHIPSVPCSMRVDRTLFVIAAQLEGQHERTKFVSTRLEDIAKVWYQNAVFIIHPGRFDNSGWAALKCAFWGSQFLRMDTQQIVTMEGLCRCSSTTPTDTSVKMIMFKIILLNRSTFHLANEPSLINIRARLRPLPIAQQQIEIYRMQYAIEFEPTNTKKKRLHILRTLCRQLKLKPLCTQYLLPVHYHHHLDMRKLYNCIPSIIKLLPFPRDIQTYIEWLTKVVRKKSQNAIQPAYINHKRKIQSFTEKPWDHCLECTHPTGIWTDVPRQTVPSMEDQTCISLFPAQHPPLHTKCRAFRYSCATKPFKFKTKASSVAKLGISSYVASLPRNTSISPETIKKLSGYCVMKSMKRNIANKRPAVITSNDVNLATAMTHNLCGEPFDKNKGETYLSCPFMAWHLIKRAFDWTGDNPQYERILDRTPQELMSDMKNSWNRLERKLKSKLPPLLHEGRLGLATAYQKYGKPEPKKRPVIDLKFDPTINIRKAAARAGIFCLNNIIGHGSFHLPNSTRLRQMLDTIQSKLGHVAKQNKLNDPVLVMMSDDIEGFFTNVDVTAAIAAHERIVQLYLDPFRNKRKVGKRKFQATARNSGKIYVPYAKSEKPVPGNYNKSKIPGRYSTVKLDELTRIIQWTTDYRTFTLGTLVLKQKRGLFQGCPLSVYLALSIAFISEHDARLSPLGNIVRGLRYVDDKMGITITENTPIKIQEAKETLLEYNQIYHDSLTVKEEPPVWQTPNDVKYVYIGHILTCNGKEIMREYYNKNWHCHKWPQPFRQVFKLEQHYGSYCDITSLRGQRMGRLMMIMRSTDLPRIRQVLCEKLYEYSEGLGDPPSFTIRLLRRLLRINTNNAECCNILVEIITAYRKIQHAGTGERNIFRILPNLNTRSILSGV